MNHDLTPASLPFATLPSPPTDPGALDWQWQPFDGLTVRALHAIHRARQQVFVVEQRCFYCDADGVDEFSWHLAAWSPASALPLAYARIVQPGVKYAEPSIGRVLTLPSARGTGLGRALVQRAIKQTAAVYPGQGIRISAQSRLERFYGELGFVVAGEPYLEDDILHTEMVRAS